MDGPANRVSSYFATQPQSRPRVRLPAHSDTFETTRPLISAILPTHNGASRGYLTEAIDSVLAQTYTHRELLIVNDGSTDETANQLGRYIGRDIRILHQLNQGLAAARNTGIRHARGEYICFLDDDDRWLPEKLERQMEFFVNCTARTDGRVKMIYTPIRLINERGQTVGRQAHMASGDIYQELFTVNLIDSPSSVMIKRDVLNAVGSFDPTLRSIEDLDLWLRIAQDFEIHSMTEPLVEYRVHDNKMSNRLETMYSWRRRVVERAIDNNRRHDVQLDRRAILFDIEKQYFDRCLQVADAEGAERHFLRAWSRSPWLMLTRPKMWVKMLMAKVGLVGRFVADSSRAVPLEVEIS
jgi:glycosyltransferase involved in cell wall biosynthesis